MKTITIDKTNGGKGRINTIRLFEDGDLSICIHILRDQSTIIHNPAMNRILEANEAGYLNRTNN